MLDIYVFLLLQVVGGIEENMPTLPSTSGVEIISYSRLHDEVYFITTCIVVISLPD